jgi:hypothetical protein
MKPAAKEEAHRAINIPTDKRMQFQVRLSVPEIEATICSIADTDSVVNQLGREIYGVTSTDQMQFKKEFSISLVEFEAW